MINKKMEVLKQEKEEIVGQLFGGIPVCEGKFTFMGSYGFGPQS
jgi:hypothetical protein